MEDRAMGPAQWEEMPKAAYDPAARLQTMDQDGIECAVLYPTLAGFSGERFRCNQRSRFAARLRTGL
jgi:hypothetical protein